MLRRFLPLAVALALAAATPAWANGIHDFDFEFGTWKAVLKTREPLTRANAWTTFRGTSIVRQIWDGRANLGELRLQGARGHIDALSLRLFDPKAQLWNVYFANASTGILGAPDVGGFHDGRGLFYNRETYDGKPVEVRFTFSDITTTSFSFVQSYSADGGTTWIPNWVATFVR